MTTSSTIAEINDICRQRVHVPVFDDQSIRCRIVFTNGFIALSPEAQIILGSMIRDFNTFTPENDPYGEHDFGAVEYDGHRVFWKIDYYTDDLLYCSKDPTDLMETVRVLTIMLASEC
jgi:hypothetical protein